MRGAVIEKSIELLLVRGLLIRNVDLVYDHEVTLGSTECGRVGQIAFTYHLRTVPEDGVLCGTFRIQVHYGDRIEGLGVAPDQFQTGLSLASARHTYEQCAEWM
jgi:hypothetical protein